MGTTPIHVVFRPAWITKVLGQLKVNFALICKFFYTSSYDILLCNYSFNNNIQPIYKSEIVYKSENLRLMGNPAACNIFWRVEKNPERQLLGGAI